MAGVSVVDDGDGDPDDSMLLMLFGKASVSLLMEGNKSIFI